MLKKIEKIKGLGIAIVTPFTNKGEVDYECYKKIINYNIERGVDYIVFLGTTGESPTLSLQEKINIISFGKRIIKKRTPIVIGIGGNNTHNIIDSFSKYNFADIDAILSVSPCYNKPSQLGIIKHYTKIADKAPKPIILYNVPGRTASNMEADTTIYLSKHKNIIAIKEASGNIKQIKNIIRNTNNNFIVISGDDDLTIDIIKHGGSGVISVAAQALPKEFKSHIIQNKSDKNFKIFFDLIFQEGNPSGIKSALNTIGLCNKHVRLPLTEVSAKTHKKIESFIKNFKK